MKKTSMILFAFLLVLCLSFGNCLAHDEARILADQGKRDEFFMAQALDLARSAVRHGNYPFGAILVKGGRVVVRAENTAITDRTVSHHAEINAVDKAFRDLGIKTLKGYTLYASSEPCPMCSGAIFITEVSTVVYGAPQRYLESLIHGYKAIGLTRMTNLPDQYVRLRGPVLREAAEKILKNYVEAKRRKRTK